MQKKGRKIFSMAVAACMIFGCIPAYAEDIAAKDVNLTTTPNADKVTVADGKFSIENVTYQTYDQSDDAMKHLGNVTIDGAEYTVQSVSEPKYIRKDSIKPETTSYTSEVWTGDGEKQKPEDTIELDGITYQLENLYKEENKSQERTETKDATVAYTAIEYGVKIPEEKAITFTDVDTKQEVTATIPLKSQEVTNEYWDDNFQFDITVSGYNAETYTLGSKEIPATDDLNDYTDDFLSILALPSDHYKIDSITWDGEQYTEDGLVKRKAIGKGEKLVQDIDAVYEGEVTLPETVGYVWVADYKEVIPEDESVVYTMAVNVEYGLATATAESQGFLAALFGTITGFITAVYNAVADSFKEHPVITTIPFVVVAGLIAFLITRKLKHRCIYQNDKVCPYKKHTKETCKSCPNFYQRGAVEKKGFDASGTFIKTKNN